MKKRIKTAILGSGFMGRVHLEAIYRLGFVDVCAVAGLHVESARKLAAEFGVERVEQDYRRILDDPEVDAVHICSRTAHHEQMLRDALEAGKHILCEKPLGITVQGAREIVDLAASKGVRNCVNHTLRYYPMVQQMRRMREAGELGEILVVQGTYAQDYLLYDTDWNWRLNAAESGPSCAMADIGSHLFDMAEHITGLRVNRLCADLNTFHPTRKRPTGWVETFSGKMHKAEEYQETAVDTEDFGSVIFHLGGRARGAFTAGQVFCGRKNRLFLEVYGSKGSVAWDQERPEELWIGNRNAYNQTLLKDPSLVKPEVRSFADTPAGHAEGYPDTFKNVFRRFYRSIEDPSAEPDYPQFADGLRQLTIIEAELASNRKQGWVDVPLA